MKKKFLVNHLPKLLAVFSILITTIAGAQEKEKSLVLKVEKEPYILRCFSEFDKKVKSHSIAVGNPSQIHYLYDANSGSLLKVWKGEFVDAGPMWLGRGGGFFKTPSQTKDISDSPTFAVLQNKNDTWPDSLNATLNYRFKGYKLDKQRNPTFRYTLSNYEVQDQIIPLDSKDGLNRSITISSPQSSPAIYVLLAEGSDIRKSSKNIYTITGRDFAIKIDDSGAGKPVIRGVNGKKELLLQLPSGTQSVAKYSIIF